MITVNKEWCVKCKATNVDFIKYTSRTNKDGRKIQYFMCNPCNAQKRMKYYYNGNQQKIMEANRRYRQSR